MAHLHSLIIPHVYAAVAVTWRRPADRTPGGGQQTTCMPAYVHTYTGRFVGEWLFVFPLCGFSLSLFCNYTGRSTSTSGKC